MGSRGFERINTQDLKITEEKVLTELAGSLGILKKKFGKRQLAIFHVLVEIAIVDVTAAWQA